MEQLPVSLGDSRLEVQAISWQQKLPFRCRLGTKRKHRRVAGGRSVVVAVSLEPNGDRDVALVQG